MNTPEAAPLYPAVIQPPDQVTFVDSPFGRSEDAGSCTETGYLLSPWEFKTYLKALQASRAESKQGVALAAGTSRFTLGGMVDGERDFLPPVAGNVLDTLRGGRLFLVFLAHGEEARHASNASLGLALNAEDSWHALGGLFTTLVQLSGVRQTKGTYFARRGIERLMQGENYPYTDTIAKWFEVACRIPVSLCVVPPAGSTELAGMNFLRTAVPGFRVVEAAADGSMALNTGVLPALGKQLGNTVTERVPIREIGTYLGDHLEGRTIAVTAQAADISSAALSNTIAGRERPRFLTAARLVGALGRTLDLVFTPLTDADGDAPRQAFVLSANHPPDAARRFFVEQRERLGIGLEAMAARLDLRRGAVIEFETGGHTLQYVTILDYYRRGLNLDAAYHVTSAMQTRPPLKV